jgi:ADP-L-glycero-D-manno-heptose 6-epimerase
MKTILVTGGGGFIGSNLVAELLKRKTHHIVVCDEFGTGDKWRNLSKHPTHEIVPTNELFGWLDANHTNLEMIYHLGSLSSTTEERIDMVLHNNFTLSLKLWRWCNAHSVRLIYASAAATYGNGANGFDDNMEIPYLHSLTPLSGYGWSKHLFDTHVATAVSRGQVSIPQWAGFKFFNAYGPNEYHKENQRSVISQIAPHAIEHSSIKLFRSYNSKYPDGEQKRDMIYVKDIVKVLLWCLDNPAVSGLFNLGTGQASSFNAMAKAIFAALGHDARVSYIDMPSSIAKKYQYFTEAKMDRLRAAGYSAPFTSLQDGVKDYVQNYLLKEDPYL